MSGSVLKNIRPVPIESNSKLLTRRHWVRFPRRVLLDNNPSLGNSSVRHFCTEREMAQPSKEPCKKEACDIQACLTKNNFIPQKFVFLFTPFFVNSRYSIASRFGHQSPSFILCITRSFGVSG